MDGLIGKNINTGHSELTCQTLSAASEMSGLNTQRRNAGSVMSKNVMKCDVTQDFSTLTVKADSGACCIDDDIMCLR